MGIIIKSMEESKVDNLEDAIKTVIKNSRAVDGLVKGLNQVGKSLDRKEPYLCILAEDCDDSKYKKLIECLAKQQAIPLIKVDSRMDLGEWLGQAKYDLEGNARKVKGCSSVAILDYGAESTHLDYLETHIKENGL